MWVFAAEKTIGAKPAENEVGIRDRRLLAAQPIADRTGLRAGALRADLQRAQAACARDAAAAGADFHQVHHRHLDGEAAAFLEALHAPDFETLHHRRDAALDEAGFRGRAAHVEAEHLGAVEQAAVVLRGDHRRGRARFDDAHRELCRSLGRGDAPRGEHDEQPAAEAQPGQALAHAPQVGLGERLHVGVGHRGAGALVLPDLRQHLVGDRERGLRQLLGQQPLQRQLVRRVLERIEQAHGDRLDAEAGHLAHRLARLRLVQRREHAAVGAQAFVHLEAPFARHQRLGHLGEGVVGGVADLAPEFQHVAKAARGDEAGARALALDDRVDHQGGAVDHLLQPLDAARDPAGEGAQALLDGIRRVARRGEALVGAGAPARIVQ